MKNSINLFEKKKEFLICIDSDGCVMDTMDVKHIKCFGPCIIKEWHLEEWHLEEWEELILKRWNTINLYTMTRGINRFKGLALMLEEINEKYTQIEDAHQLVKWTNKSNELSNEALIRAIDETDSIIFKKALAWSKAVNESIGILEDSEKLPFELALEGLQAAKAVADVAIVSSANLGAVEEEWEEHGLLTHTDVVLAQNTGTKAFCIEKLLEKGYDKDKVVMIGDAPGDYEAALKNGVCYYPILVGKEKESWARFIENTLHQFTAMAYKGEEEDQMIQAFKNNLSEN